MIDIKAVREEMARIHAEASAHVETYANAEPSADEQTAQEERFAKLEKMQKSIDDATKLARFAYSGEQPADMPEAKRPIAILPSKSKDQLEAEAYTAVERSDYSREAVSKAVGAWISSGEIDEAYATITTGVAGGLLMPRIVATPIVPVRTNPYRVALSLYGIAAESLGNTADMSVPVISSDAGGSFGEDDIVADATDGSPNVKAISLKCKGYQSGTYRWSKLMFNAVDYDYATATQPALAGAKDRGFAKAITAAIKADTDVTRSVTTATTTTATLDNLDDAIAKVDPLYADRIVILLATSLHNVFSKLKDSTGVPILSRNNVQTDSFLRYKGVPVIADDTLDAMGTAGNLVGVVIGVDGFKLRDESSELLRFPNSEKHIGKMGLNLIGYHAHGYVPEAVVKIVN